MRRQTPIVSNCCYCVSLRTGSLVFGYISLVCYVVGSVGSLAWFGMAVAELLAWREYYRPIESYEYVIGFPIIITLSTTLPLSIVGSIFSGMLVNGIHKARPNIMIPWIGLQSLTLLMTLTTTVAVCIIMPAGVIIGSSVASWAVATLYQVWSIVIILGHVQEIIISQGASSSNPYNLNLGPVIPPVDYENFTPSADLPQLRYVPVLPRAEANPTQNANRNEPNGYPRNLERQGSNVGRRNSTNENRPTAHQDRRNRY